MQPSKTTSDQPRADRESITAWVTSYALTRGILQVEGEVCHDVSSSMLSYGNGLHHMTAHGNDWHRTPEAALARAEEMRRVKIKSLKKQMDKLRELKFKFKVE